MTGEKKTLVGQTTFVMQHQKKCILLASLTNEYIETATGEDQVSKSVFLDNKL